MRRGRRHRRSWRGSRTIEPEPGAFTIGLAAQSWHWVDPDRGAAVMARALRPGGVLALVWNTPAEDRSPLRLAIEQAYARHVPELVESSVVNRPASRRRLPAVRVRGW